MIPAETIDKIRCMIIDGYRDTEIERSTGVCRKTITKIRKPYGPYRPGRLFNLFAEDRKTMSAARVAETEQYNDLTIIVRMLDKIGRITKGNGAGNEDAWGDLALLGKANVQNRRS